MSKETKNSKDSKDSVDVIDSRKLLSDLSFCVIDLETTGGNHDIDKIIEIGMVRIQDLKIVAEKNLLIDPEMNIPDFIQKLTSIKQKDVKGKPKIEDVIGEILDFIQDDIIVAHNTSFDVPFLNSVLRRSGRDELQNKVICTNVMTKHMIPEIMNSNLNYMSQLFNIGHTNAHRASDDARATANLLLKYLEIFIRKGIKKVNQLYYPRNRFELDRIHFDKATPTNEILSIIDKNTTSMVLTFKGDRGLILGVLPIENPKEEIDMIKEMLDVIDWEILTIKLTKPFIEGIFQFNNHFMKYPLEIREKTLNYLNQRYNHNKIPKEFTVNALDFVICHHLVREQFIVYSFLHLNTNTKAIFKFPAQKKKMLQFLSSLNNRFENNQKGRRKNLLHAEIIPLVESYLYRNRSSNKHFFLARKTVKGCKDDFFKLLEQFSHQDQDDYHFPRQSF